MTDKTGVGTGASVDLDIIGVAKAHVEASDATLARFFSASADELRQLRSQVIKIKGKSLRKKIKASDYEALDPLERFLLEAAFSSLLHREAEKVSNRIEAQEAIQRRWDQQFPGNALPPTRGTPKTFIDRFWDDVANVSDEAVRDAYARAAVRELSQSCSMSVNTLEVLKRMDAATVQWFEVAACLVCDRENLLLPHSRLAREYEARGLNRGAVTHLCSVGLFTNADMWTTRFVAMPPAQGTFAVWGVGPYLGRQLAQPIRGLLCLPVCGAVQLTTAGMELMGIVERKTDFSDFKAVTVHVVDILSKTSGLKIGGSPEFSDDEGRTWTAIELEQPTREPEELE